MTWFTTYTGKRVDFTSLTKDSICLIDIAHSLSMQCRYNGHIKTFYSVAQHCCLMLEQGRRLGWEDEVLKYVLLHDAAEAYTGDLPRPLKLLLGHQFQLIEEDLEEVILGKYLKEGFDPDDIKFLDDQFLCLEAYYLVSNWRHVWRAFDNKFLKTVNYLLTQISEIDCWSSDEAKTNFLAECKRLGMEY